MKKDRPDVIQFLEEEKTYHQKQIERINAAIAAYQDKPIESPKTLPSAKIPDRIPWTKKVMEILEGQPERVFQVEEIHKELIARGLPHDVVEKNKLCIYNVFQRGVKSGKIAKAGYGKYKKYQKEGEEPPYGQDSSP